MKINDIVSKEDKIQKEWTTIYLRIVKKHLLKEKDFETARKKIKEELQKVIPNYVRKGLVLGVQWLNKDE